MGLLQECQQGSPALQAQPVYNFDHSNMLLPKLLLLLLQFATPLLQQIFSQKASATGRCAASWQLPRAVSLP